MMNLSQFDAVVVGCGLTGSVIARHFAEQGKRVLILERRNHIGGNMYDYIEEHGFLVQKYGPHAFHTQKKSLYDYMCRFEEWLDYKLTCGAVIDGKCTPTPFNFQTIDDFYSKIDADILKEHIKVFFGDCTTVTVVEALACQDPIIQQYAQFLFDKDYSLYTAKQWGITPSEIDSSVLKRVPLRFSYEVGYFDDEFQVMPKTSFTHFFENLLDHENIIIQLCTDALDHIKIRNHQIYFDDKYLKIPLIYSGQLDALFEYKFGKLPYRSLRFEWKFKNEESMQEMPVVAYPQADGFTRITEYKKLPVQTHAGTVYAVEYPVPYINGQNAEPYYPVLTQDSQKQYEKYQKSANQTENLICCGRLGDFKYYNMDQALERALEICAHFKQEDDFGWRGL